MTVYNIAKINRFAESVSKRFRTKGRYGSNKPLPVAQKKDKKEAKTKGQPLKPEDDE